MNVPFAVGDYVLVLLSGLSVSWVVNYDLHYSSNVGYYDK
jgi:hypothetical protein